MYLGAGGKEGARGPRLKKRAGPPLLGSSRLLDHPDMQTFCLLVITLDWGCHNKTFIAIVVNLMT